VGWYEHHSRMLHNEHFSSSFDAWCDMDKQLCMQFINRPLIIDQTDLTYMHLLECVRMDSPTVPSHNKCLSHTIPFRPTCHITHHAPTLAAIPHHDTPHMTRHNHNSCWDGKKLTLCLWCGVHGHCANTCSSSHSSWLVSNKNKIICILFNVHGHCVDNPTPSHGEHSCSLCGNTTHLVSCCTRN